MNFKKKNLLIFPLLIALGLILMFFLGRVSDQRENNNPWAVLTTNDLTAIRELIRSNHPASADKEESHEKFLNWLSLGYERSMEMARDVSSFEGYKFTLAYYIGGFKDGHLRLRTIEKNSLRWPGFLLTYQNGKYFINSEIMKPPIGDLPPNGAEVIACNNKDPSLLMRSNIFPYVSDDPTVESSWKRLTPLLLVDQGNPWAEKISQIKYRWNGIDSLFELKRYINLEQKINEVPYGKPPDFKIKDFGETGVWISIPTFNSQSSDVKKSLEEIVNRLPSFRNKNPIVFDVRGNGGGASTWIVEMLKSFYGEEYLGSLPHIKNENSLADDRLSPKVIQQMEGLLPEENFNKLKEAYNRGDLFSRRPTDVHEFSQIKKTVEKIQNPVRGRVYVLTDGNCFSSCLIFADSILSIPGVVQIGDTTNADTKFSQPIAFELPSGISTVMIPSMVRRNWERGDNEPYIPTHQYPGFMGDQKKLEEWVITLFKAEKTVDD